MVDIFCIVSNLFVVKIWRSDALIGEKLVIVAHGNSSGKCYILEAKFCVIKKQD